MSTGTKVPHAQALDNAKEFRALFTGAANEPAAYERWTIAGSLRRLRPEVGDVEHVVIPRKGIIWEASGEASLFGGAPKAKVERNELWARMDSLVESGVLKKAVYGDTGHRWGEKYRGVVFKGVRHELFAADDHNYGAILAIRTGPSGFSMICVSRLKHAGIYRQQGGYLVRVADDAVIPVPDEEMYLRLCGVPMMGPEERDAWAEARA